MSVIKNSAEKMASFVRKATQAGDFGFAAVIFASEFIRGENMDEIEAAEIWETWLPDLKEERREVFGYICW